MASERMVRLGRAALPILAIVSFTVGVGSTIAFAGDTLGYDYRAYVAAAERFVNGQPLYDPTVNVAGPFAIYLYPPPFALAFVPFVALPPSAGLWLWTIGCIAMTLAAIAIMPVSARTRWAMVGLAGLDWPVAFAIKLGQVGPLLLLLFVFGWRFLRSDRALGAVGALGTLIKVQPALLFAWALLIGRRKAVAIGIGLTAIAALLSLPFVGLASWFDYARLLGRVAAPVTTPHNMTVGAVAYQAGLSEPIAGALQLVVLVLTIVVWVFAARRRAPEVGYVVTIVASQLLSPLLWDHYAMLLLLPVAWLLQHRQRWAAAIPLVTSLPLISIVPAAIYPIVFLTCLLAPVVVTRASRP